jgi:hypothetical protein
MVKRISEKCLAFKEENSGLRRAVNSSKNKIESFKDSRKTIQNSNKPKFRGSIKPPNKEIKSKITYFGILQRGLYKNTKSGDKTIELQAQLLRNIIPKHLSSNETKIRKGGLMKVRLMKKEHIYSYLDDTIKKSSCARYYFRHCLAYFKFTKKGNRTISHSKEFLAKRRVKLKNIT